MWLKGKFIHTGILLNVAAAQPRRRWERNSRSTMAYAIAARYRRGGRAFLRLPAAPKSLKQAHGGKALRRARQRMQAGQGSDASLPTDSRHGMLAASCSRYSLARCASRQVAARSSQIRPIRHIEYSPRRISAANRAVDQPISADLVHIFFGRELTMILRLFAVGRQILFSPPGVRQPTD
jgi:hypothetical protein